jgi:hypothetical protein
VAELLVNFKIYIKKYLKYNFNFEDFLIKMIEMIEEIGDDEIEKELKLNNIISEKTSKKRVEDLCILTRIILSNKDLIKICNYEDGTTNLGTTILKSILKCINKKKSKTFGPIFNISFKNNN